MGNQAMRCDRTMSSACAAAQRVSHADLLARPSLKRGTFADVGDDKEAQASVAPLELDEIVKVDLPGERRRRGADVSGLTCQSGVEMRGDVVACFLPDLRTQRLRYVEVAMGSGAPHGQRSLGRARLG
jgi:hypothetical protein